MGCWFASYIQRVIHVMYEVGYSQSIHCWYAHGRARQRKIENKVSGLCVCVFFFSGEELEDSFTLIFTRHQILKAEMLSSEGPLPRLENAHGKLTRVSVVCIWQSKLFWKLFTLPGRHPDVRACQKRIPNILALHPQNHIYIFVLPLRGWRQESISWEFRQFLNKCRKQARIKYCGWLEDWTHDFCWV